MRGYVLTIGDEEATLRLSADLIDDGAQNAPVAVRELGVVRVRGVKVKGSILSLQQRQKTTSDEGLSIGRRAQVMGRVAAGRHIGDVDEGAESVLQ